MKTLRTRIAVALAAAGVLSLGTTAAQANQGGASADATAYLELQAQPDNHCMLRDPTGKLVVLINKHPSKAIRYRVVRVFAGHIQPGMGVGIIAAGSDPVPLGCSVIDQREQHWEVRSAQFTATPKPSATTASDQQGEK